MALTGILKSVSIVRFCDAALLTMGSGFLDRVLNFRVFVHQGLHAFDLLQLLVLLFLQLVFHLCLLVAHVRNVLSFHFHGGGARLRVLVVLEHLALAELQFLALLGLTRLLHDAFRAPASQLAEGLLLLAFGFVLESFCGLLGSLHLGQVDGDVVRVILSSGSLA